METVVVASAGDAKRKKKKVVMESSSITNGIHLLTETAMKIQKDEEEENN